jgi:DNA-binding HxlR family transcriptional regulator
LDDVWRDLPAAESTHQAMPKRFDRNDGSECSPAEAALEQISGKWEGVIIHHLIGTTLRFNELSRRIASIR